MPWIRAYIAYHNAIACAYIFFQAVQSFSGLADPALQAAVADLSLDDLNPVLYRCDAEEKDDNGGNGAYNVPGHGTLIFAGLQVGSEQSGLIFAYLVALSVYWWKGNPHCVLPVWLDRQGKHYSPL